MKQVDYLQLVDSFTDPFLALDYLKNNKIDLVFLDVDMPKMSDIKFRNEMPQDIMVILFPPMSQRGINIDA